MKQNLEIKTKAFEYILYKLFSWRNEVPINMQRNWAMYKIAGRNSSDIDFPQELLEKNNFTMLFPFFVCIASTDRKKMFSLFDNFIADEIGIIEKDLDEAYSSNCKISVPMEKFDFPGVPYRLIDDSFKLLQEMSEVIVNWSPLFLGAYSKGHFCWFVYSKFEKKSKIPIEILEKEKTYFTTDARYLLLC